MKFDLLCNRAIIGALLTGATAMAGVSNKPIIDSVRAMERELGLTIATPNILVRNVQRTQQVPGLLPPAISPDGTALAWWSAPIPGGAEKVPILTVETLKEGKQPVRVEARIALHSVGVSSGAEVIVATALPVNALQGRSWQLLAIDRRTGGVIHDITRFVTEFNLGNDVWDISVSGPGTIAALGTHQAEQIQVLDIPSGKTMYAGHGHCPRVSPDGKRLAFVDQDRLWVHSFADGSKVQLLKEKRVKGVGGWSPDGRFLLAGAWTTRLAFEKRQIIVDTISGEYAVLGKLGEGDYGCEFAWVSVKLLNR